MNRAPIAQNFPLIASAIYLYWRNVGYAPSLREVCEATYISSTSVLKYRLEAMREAGLVLWSDGTARTLRLTVDGELLAMGA